jgi:hypothetical protein
MNINLLLARSLSVFDIIIYFLRPLVIAIAIIAAGYFIYRWYTKRKMVRI